MSEKTGKIPAEIAVEALYEAGAQCLAEVPGPNDSEIRFFSLIPDGRLRIVQTFHGTLRAGFEIYKPVSTKNKTQATIAAALAPDEPEETPAAPYRTTKISGEHYVGGPGIVPNLLTEDAEQAEHLASWLNVAYAQGKSAARRESKKGGR